MHKSTKRYYKKACTAVCPDCGEETFVEIGSLYGEIDPDEVREIDPEVVTKIVRDLVLYGYLCLTCNKTKELTYLLWVQVGEMIMGPYYGSCYSGYTHQGEFGGSSEERKVYLVRNRESTRLAVDYVQEMLMKRDHEELTEDPPQDPDASDLF